MKIPYLLPPLAGLHLLVLSTSPTIAQELPPRSAPPAIPKPAIEPTARSASPSASGNSAPTFQAVILSAEYDLTLTPSSAQLDAQYRILSVGPQRTLVPLLGGDARLRTTGADVRLTDEVQGNWGSPMNQLHPRIYYISPTSAHAKRLIEPTRSRITVDLDYDPKKKGLLWYRTYRPDFVAEYFVTNPTPISQTIYVSFDFPATNTRFDRFTLSLDGVATGKSPRDSAITESVLVPPGAEVPVKVTYQTTGLNEWRYSFGDNPTIHDLVLRMTTNFDEINIPNGTESPHPRHRTSDGWSLEWNYSDVIGARAIRMDMPAVVNPGPVASRMIFFAPVSLVFFFAVLVIVGTVRGINLHPMNFVFLAGGLFAFQLLFAYLVDLMPVMTAFTLSAATSLLLVTSYLWETAGARLARLSAVAQFGFMTLFSYSFFFKGLTGITITVGAILTLALLMASTARLDWERSLTRVPRKRQSASGDAPAIATPPPLA